MFVVILENLNFIVESNRKQIPVDSLVKGGSQTPFCILLLNFRQHSMDTLLFSCFDAHSLRDFL